MRKRVRNLIAIQSTQHPIIQRVIRLRDRAERDASGFFFVDGIRFVLQAQRYARKMDAVLLCREMLRGRIAENLVAQLARSRIPCFELPPSLFLELSFSERPQGLAAIAAQRWTHLRFAKVRRGCCWVALHRIQAPGNLGTIVRTCDAAGAAGVMLLGQELDPYHPTSVRSTMGSIFAQQFVRTTHERFRKWATRHGCRVIGTSPRAHRIYDELNSKSPIILLIGGERKGITRRERRICDEVVRIPMFGSCDSLNVAVATGVMLYGACRSRWNRNRSTARSRGAEKRSGPSGHFSADDSLS